jgi:hypothetical protein
VKVELPPPKNIPRTDTPQPLKSNYENNTYYNTLINPNLGQLPSSLDEDK